MPDEQTITTGDVATLPVEVTQPSIEYVVLEELWADRETGKAVRLEGGDRSQARLGAHPKVSHKLTIPGQVFTQTQVEQYGLADFVLVRNSDEARLAVEGAKAAAQAAAEQARVARIEALHAELARLEGPQ